MPFIQTLFSGSSGNCTLVAGERSALLVDMGRSCRMTLNALYELGLSASDLEAILITHEHIDHVAGLKTFLKHYKVPVMGLPACLRYIRERGLVPDDAELIPIEDEVSFDAIGAKVTPFRTNHDSMDCCGYRFDFPGVSAAIATDIGKVTDSAMRRMLGCSMVCLESNYDDGALLAGSYPFSLKQRIRSDFGHLSNADCAGAAIKLVEGGTRCFSLMHLSDENNSPSLAETTFCGFLENYGIEGVTVRVAPRNCPGERFSL